MSKKIVKAIRDSEEHLTKIRSELPPELQKVIDFLFNAVTSNVDDNFFNKIFKLEDVEVKKVNGSMENVILKQKTGIIVVIMENLFTESFGNTLTAKFLKVTSFITLILILQITTSRT